MNYTWRHDVNQIIPQGASTLATNRALLLALVASLKAGNFTVVRSCDGVTVGAAGDGVDRWVDAADLVFAPSGGAHSWMVLQGLGFQLLIDLVSPTVLGDQLRIRGSISGFDTGGTVFAAPTASAGDAFVVGDGTDTYLNNANGAYVLHVIDTPSADAPAIVSIWRDGVAQALAFIGGIGAFPSTWDAVIGSWATASCTDVGLWDFTASLAPQAQITLSAVTVGDGIVNGVAYLNHEMWASAGDSINDGVGYAVYPAAVYSEEPGIVGHRGHLPDIFVARFATPSSGKVATMADGNRFAIMGGFLIPWDASTVRIDDNVAPLTDTVATTIVSGAALGGALVVPSVEPLAATAAAARWTPISAEFDVPAGHKATVIVKIGADSGVWLVAYSDVDATHFNGFSPLFADKSSVTITGTADAGWHYEVSVLPVGGWHRPDGVISHLIVREAA